MKFPDRHEIVVPGKVVLSEKFGGNEMNFHRDIFLTLYSLLLTADRAN